jgi:hypothetical protein
LRARARGASLDAPERSVFAGNDGERLSPSCDR